jgi:hypothetical protein
LFQYEVDNIEQPARPASESDFRPFFVYMIDNLYPYLLDYSDYMKLCDELSKSNAQEHDIFVRNFKKWRK